MFTGQVRRAAQALNSTTTMADCTDPAVQDMLRALHPPLSSTAQLPSMPSDTEPIQLEDDSTLRRILRGSNNGAAGGPSGWAGNMLSVLVDSVPCRIGLIRLLQDVINGNIPNTVRPHLLACRLVAINKPGIKAGVRPIAMGELFYRVSAILAMHRVRDIAANLLLPHQYGVGVPGGCERIVHSLQHCLTDRSHRVCALKIDITNAFNTVDRVQLLNKLYAIPQLSPIWRLVQFAYATDSPLLLQRCENVSLSSSNGVRQGDPLSGLLFCLYLQETLAAVAQEASVQPYAYMDDLHVVGTPQQVIHALELLQTQLPHLSLKINTKKSQFIYFHENSHPLPLSVLTSLRQQDISLVDRHTIVLGAVIGATEDDIITGLSELWSGNFSMSPFFRRLISGELSVQNAMLLLRQCGVPKMTYLTRCIPSACMGAITDEFDQLVLRSALNILDIGREECTQHTFILLRVPLKYGGFSLTSMRHTAPQSYISSLASMAASNLPSKFTAYCNKSEYLHAFIPLSRWIEEALTDLAVQHDSSGAALSLTAPAHIRAPSSISHLPHDSQSFFPFYHSDQPSMASDLQRHLSQLATHTDLQHAAREARRYHQPRVLTAHHNTITAPDAAIWKTVQPMSSQHVLADAHYRISARLNLLLPPFPGHVPATCSSCNTVSALQHDPWHYLSCIHHRRKEVTLRTTQS